MALSYTVESSYTAFTTPGLIANADNISDSAGGSWSANGSGGASITQTTDTFYYGSSSISSAVSGNNKWCWITYDTGAGNTLDFTPSTGAQAGEFIYIWIHCPTIGLSTTLANAGVSIRIGSSTANYREYVVAGNNGSNGWTGDWRCFVIDPSIASPQGDSGSPNIASIRYIGPQLYTTGTAKGDNLFVSQIMVGKGLRITGTSTTAWLDTVSYCTDRPNRAWGMFQEREGIFYSYGNVYIGDSTATTDFDDEGRTIQFGVSEYWSGTGTAFQSSLPTTGSSSIILEDGTSTTTFTDGVLVGTDNGRSGSTIVGSVNESTSFDASGLTNAGSQLNLYSTTFKNFVGGLTFESDVDHKVYGATFQGSGQVIPNITNFRNCIFSETIDTAGALYWSQNINIQNSQFIANSTGAGIEIDTDWGSDGEENFISLTFSGNTFDVNNTTGSALTVNKLSSSNPSTFTGSSVTFAATFTLTMTNIPSGTQVTIVNSSTRTELYHQTSTGVDMTYPHSGGETVDIMLISLTIDPNLSDIFNLTLDNANQSIKFQTIDELNYEAGT